MIKEQLGSLILTSMKNKDKTRTETLRAIKTEFMKWETAKNAKPLDEIAVLKKMVSQRQDSVSQYRAAGREDLATNEEAEIRVLQEFIPAAPSNDTILRALGELGITTMKDGIQELKSMFPGADGKVIAELVKNYLGK